ncbi:MAG: sigma-70 family RNA polymerase sigma factor [Bacteroidota bacterium]
MIFRRKDISSFTDETLLDLYQKEKKSKYLGVLFQRYTHLCVGTAMKYMRNKLDAEDVVMTVFEKLTQELHKKEVQHFKSYLYVSIRNQCLMILRKEKKEISSELLEEVHWEDEGGFDPEKEAQLNQLESAIQQLSADQAKCVELFYLKQMSYRQIEESTSYTLKEVKSHIQNGKRNLSIRMKAS